MALHACHLWKAFIPDISHNSIQRPPWRISVCYIITHHFVSKHTKIIFDNWQPIEMPYLAIKSLKHPLLVKKWIRPLLSCLLLSPTGGIGEINFVFDSNLVLIFKKLWSHKSNVNQSITADLKKFHMLSPKHDCHQKQTSITNLVPPFKI